MCFQYRPSKPKITKWIACTLTRVRWTNVICILLYVQLTSTRLYSVYTFSFNAQTFYLSKRVPVLLGGKIFWILENLRNCNSNKLSRVERQHMSNCWHGIDIDTHLL